MSDFKTGDQVNVLDSSWSYEITTKLETHTRRLQELNPWTVVESDLDLPTPLRSSFDLPSNDTIIRNGDVIVFTHSRFLEQYLARCPACFRPYNGQNTTQAKA